MPGDNLPEILYGKTVKVKLADGTEYIFRELDYDTISSMEFSNQDPNNPSDIKRIAWALLKYDNPTLSESKLGRLITLSMMKEGSDFMNAIKIIMGQTEQADPKA